MKSGLVARGTKTLVPSHEQLGSAEIKVTVESEAADEDSEASGGITDLAVEARGASVVPTGKVAGEGSTVATEVRVKTRTGAGTRCLNRFETKVEATDGDERVSTAKCFGIEDRTEVGGGPANAGRALEVVDLASGEPWTCCRR